MTTRSAFRCIPQSTTLDIRVHGRTQKREIPPSSPISTASDARTRRWRRAALEGRTLGGGITDKGAGASLGIWLRPNFERSRRCVLRLFFSSSRAIADIPYALQASSGDVWARGNGHMDRRVHVSILLVCFVVFLRFVFRLTQTLFHFAYIRDTYTLPLPFRRRAMSSGTLERLIGAVSSPHPHSPSK